MSEFSRDPKGYYAMLDVTADADAEEIKSAFRTKAKRLHPDINPSPIAAKQFQRLSEAYEALSDPAKRKSYDAKAGGPEKKKETKAKASARPSGEDKAKTTSAEETKTERPQKKPQPRTEQKSANPKGANQDSKPSTKTQAKPETCQCGKVTAQPRYIVFDMVAGKGRRVDRRPVAGVFCRTCADKAALKASFITWLAGWWAFPNGPKETIKALWNNIRGGRKPADRNTRLLIRQALAFRDKGDLTLARGTAEQALIFARTPDLRREVDKLLLSLSAHKAKALRTRWDKPGWAALVQIAPVLVVVVWASMTLTLNTPQSITGMVSDAVRFVTGREETLRSGDTLYVRTPALNVRTGPGRDYQAVEILAADDSVIVQEIAPDRDWVRVSTPSGAEGFVLRSALKPGATED